MKITRTEKIWLVVVVAIYICYNLPFVPAYHHPVATIVHGIITLVPLWIAIYVGFFKVCRLYPIRSKEEIQKRMEQAKLEQEKLEQKKIEQAKAAQAKTDQDNLQPDKRKQEKIQSKQEEPKC